MYNLSNPSLSRRVRIVLDNRSRRSYLTQGVRDKLALVTMSTHQLSIAAFGSKQAQARPCDVVRVKIKARSQRELELDLFVVPHICDLLTAQPASTCFKEYSHLSHLNFADDSVDGAPREIDMLIGSDSYWSIVTGEILRGSGGPVAVNTRLGWVPSGPVELAGLTTVNLVFSHTLQVDSTKEDIDATLKAFWELESLGIKSEIDPVQDQHIREIAKVERDLSPTKRNVISLIGRIYDPLGFLTPITISFKIFMQELCKLGPRIGGYSTLEMEGSSGSVESLPSHRATQMLPQESSKRIDPVSIMWLL